MVTYSVYKRAFIFLAIICLLSVVLSGTLAQQRTAAAVQTNQYNNDQVGLSLSYPSYWRYAEKTVNGDDVVFYVPSAQAPSNPYQGLMILMINVYTPKQNSWYPSADTPISVVGNNRLAYYEQNMKGFKPTKAYQDGQDGYVISFDLGTGYTGEQFLRKCLSCGDGALLQMTYTSLPRYLNTYAVDVGNIISTVKLKPVSVSQFQSGNSLEDDFKKMWEDQKICEHFSEQTGKQCTPQLWAAEEQNKMHLLKNMRLAYSIPDTMLRIWMSCSDIDRYYHICS